MKHLRAGAALSAAVLTAVALTACASNEQPAGGSSASASSGGDSSSSTSSSSASASAAPLMGQLNGEGSSAQTNAQKAWTTGIQTANSGLTINYNPVGSGAGRTAFEGGGAQFAGSDSALKTEELSGTFKLCASGTKGIDIPVYVSPVAIVYNLKGVTSLNLDATTLAKIYAGTITTWNDPAIKALNSSATLPATKITAVHRSDKSGTTNNFTDYLYQNDPTDWKTPAADAFPLSSGQGAAKGSGVVQAVTAGDGSIGYVDNSSAGTLSAAKIKVGSTYVAPSAAVASAAAENSPLDTTRTGNDTVVKVDRKPTDATQYPITLVSYLVVCQQYQDASVGTLVAGYAKYITSDAGQQAAASSAKSAPMTGTLLTKAQAAAASIK